MKKNPSYILFSVCMFFSLHYISICDREDNSIGVRLLRLIHDYIDSYQQIEQLKCKSHRLMVMQFDTNRHEGFGSIAMAITAALGIALHSNRTLIWGLELPYLLNFTATFTMGNAILHCDRDDKRLVGGNFCHFFRLLSTCTLLDLTNDEIIELGRNGHNYSSRVAFVEQVQKSIAIFHPPTSLSASIRKEVSSARILSYYKTNKQALWCTALASYVFRLNDDIKILAESTRKRYFQTLGYVGGVHVRHGDLLSFYTDHKSRKVFSFDQFATATNKILRQRDIPMDHIYVSSDSINMDKYFKSYVEMRQHRTLASAQCDSKLEFNASKETLKFDSLDNLECQSLAPRRENQNSPIFNANIIFLNSSERYRPYFGAHIATAGGACTAISTKDLAATASDDLTVSCSWNYDEMLDHLSNEQHCLLSKSERVGRVLYESIEDMYLLSHCEFLVAQGSSYFSTFSSLLLLARTGAADVTNRTVLFLDQASIAKGLTPSAFLLGQDVLNGTYGLSAEFEDMADERWAIHTKNFISGIPNTAHSSVTLTYDPWSDDLRMRISNGNIFPQLPEKVFYREAKTWLGTSSSSSTTKKSDPQYKPVWPGSCPGPMSLLSAKRSSKKGGGRQKKLLPSGDDIREYLTMVTNLGVDHFDRLHPSQAKQCWHDALKVIAEARLLHQQQQLILGPSDIASLAEMESIASGNIQAVVARPYLQFAANEYYKLTKAKNRSRKSSAAKRNASPAATPSEGVRLDLVGLREIDGLNDAIARLDEKRRVLLNKRDRLLRLHLDHRRLQQQRHESQADTESDHDAQAGTQLRSSDLAEFQCDSKRFGKLSPLPLWSWGFSRVCCDVFPYTIYLNSTGEWGQADDLHYFLRRGIVNGSTIYVFINDFPLFLRHFSSMPKSARVTVVLAMGDYGAPVEIMSPNSGRLQSKIPISISMRDFLRDHRIHRLYVQNYDLVGCSAVAQSCSDLTPEEIRRFEDKVIPLPIGVDLHTFAGRDMGDAEFRVKVCQQRLQLAELVTKAPPLAARQFAVVVSFDCSFEDSVGSYRTLGRRHLCNLLRRNNETEEKHSDQNRIDKSSSSSSKLPIRWAVQPGEKGRLRFWEFCSESVFAFAPFGKGLDTHRVWEILQLRAIPIVLSSPMDRLFKAFPIIILESWDSLFDEGDQLLADLLQGIQREFGEEPFSEEVLERLTMNYWAHVVSRDSPPA